LTWFAAPDSDLWKELKEEVGCANLVNFKRRVMSLRELRESLKTCSGHTQVQAHQTLAPSTAATGRKPPKTSLREQVASLEHLLSNSNPGIKRPTDGEYGEEEEEVHHVKRKRVEVLESARPKEKREEVHHVKHKRVEVLESARPKEEEEEVHHVKRKRVEVLESARPKEEEEGDGRVYDSEAGLFIQSEREGPYEPLVLWPLPGEGSSSGVDAARIVQVPASINSRLLPHQRDGVKFLYNLYREDRGGILGDDMYVIYCLLFHFSPTLIGLSISLLLIEFMGTR
jgi:hypothetical protein